jgi:hypothetical protein
MQEIPQELAQEMLPPDGARSPGEAGCAARPGPRRARAGLALGWLTGPRTAVTCDGRACGRAVAGSRRRPDQGDGAELGRVLNGCSLSACTPKARVDAPKTAPLALVREVRQPVVVIPTGP